MLSAETRVLSERKCGELAVCTWQSAGKRVPSDEGRTKLDTTHCFAQHSALSTFFECLSTTTGFLIDTKNP